MRKVKNKEVIRRVSDKSFKTNRVRNMIAAAAIALTAMLFTTVFTMGIGAVESFQSQTARQVGGDSHGTIKDLTREQYEAMKDHSLIKESAARILVADNNRNAEFLKRHVEQWYIPAEHYGHSFIDIIDGRKPEKEDEILMDEVSLDLLGLGKKAGQQVTLEMQIRQYDENVVSRTFTVSGVTKADSALNVGFVIVSEAYLEKYADELQPHADRYSMTGLLQMDVNFANSMNIQKKLDQIITESGYSVIESDANFVASNANWAYVSDGVGSDPVTMGALIGGLLLIIVTGYLIIYNIFRISIMKDIRNYGLLKTIGTTGRQIRMIIRRQALWLGLMGIPLGLILGFALGKILIPLLLDLSSYENMEVTVSLNPLIFIGAAAFSLVTLLISVGRPARLASKVSPIEAVRYTEGSTNQKKKIKKSINGDKLYRMALSNLARSKGKTIVVIASFSLAVILLNSVFTITNSFDMDTFLKKFVTTDFVIGNARYFNFDSYRGFSEETVAEERLTESFIEACEGLDGFEKGGRIYATGYSVGLKTDSWDVPDTIPQDENGMAGFYYNSEFYSYNLDQDGNYQVMFYGLDDFILDQIEIWEGERDLKTIREKLSTGDYILYAVRVDDNGKVIEEEQCHQPGDKVTISWKGQEKEVTVLSVIKENYYALTNRMSNEFSYYVTADVFKEMLSDQFLMSYAFNADDDKEGAIDEFLQSYTENAEPLMNFESKFKWLGEFSSLKNMVVLIGGLLTIVIGVIGILNFINSILTGIVTRKREFAMLEAIGMTKKQLTKMVILEGIYYTAFTAVASLVCGCLFSVTAIRALSVGMWFLKYQFTLIPMLCVFPLLILLGVLVPYLALKYSGKGSVVEALGQ